MGRENERDSRNLDWGRLGLTGMPNRLQNLRRELVESGVVSVEKLTPLRQECEELTAIFVTILRRAKTS